MYKKKTSEISRCKTMETGMVPMIDPVSVVGELRLISPHKEGCLASQPW